jgi:heme/copper-type cytochrome/quinol oxidase subunit 2
MFLVAILLSGVVAVAWAILIKTTPSDPQIGVEYLFTTLYAILALLVIWVTAVVVVIHRRQKNSDVDAKSPDVS